MVVKVYISGISGNKEVKKRQQRVLLILDSKNVQYEVIDIAEPENEDKKDFMQNSSTSSGATISDPNPRHPLPPQIYNEDVYCGDYDQFDMANEIDEMEKFLKLEATVTSNAEIKLGNGEIPHEEGPQETNETKDEKEEESKDEIVPDSNENASEPIESKVENGDEVEKQEDDKADKEEAENE